MKSIKINGVTIQRGNSKMGNVMHINLPPPMTCKGRPCLTDGCYAMKFYKIRKEVKNSWDSNWEALVTDRHKYFESIAEAIGKVKPKMFRWHSAGDIPDINYLFRMEAVAVQFPDTKFMCFTKQLEIVFDAERMSTGMIRPIRYVLSGWPGFNVPKQLRKMFPTAWLCDERDPDPNIPTDSLPCSGGCETCGVCWALKPGQSVMFLKH